MLAVLHVLVTPYIYYSFKACHGTFDNAHIAEARAWLSGRLDLGERLLDTALFDGAVYNVYPPLFTVLCVPVLWICPDGVPNWLLLSLLWFPVQVLTYVVFLQVLRRVLPAVLMSIAFIMGTSYYAVMVSAVTAAPLWNTDHALSQIGLLIFLLDYFGRRRIWLGGIGLLLATWSRFLAAAYWLPLLWLAWQLPTHLRQRRLAAALPVLVLTLALPMLLNTLKFSNPLDFGYRHIYVARDDGAALRAQDGLFALRFVPDNLRTLTLNFPRFERHRDRLRVLPNYDGAGLWWTTPLVLYVLVDFRRWWRERERRMVMLAVVAIVSTLLLYHMTGGDQGGYNRFSLDYMVVLLAVIAPFAFGSRRTWLTVALIIWSVAYFRILT